MESHWKQWEGRTIDRKFVLGNYLGGSDQSVVFRTRMQSGRIQNEESGADAAIKLVAADGAEMEGLLRRWNAARELTHPNLIRILAAGQTAVDGQDFVYAVEEFAEENLAQIVPERALGADEVRGMLTPLLAAVEFVHGKGLVHGRIKPSNIMASGDQIKLSSDSLQGAGAIPPGTSVYDAPEVQTAGISAASDIWSLGMTLVEVLTQHVPAWDPARMRGPEVASQVPEPFRGIAQCCLQLDPAKRCGLREIRERLEGRATAQALPVSAAPRAQQKSAKWTFGLVLAAVVAVAAFLILRPHDGQQASSGQSRAVQTSAEQPAQTQAPSTSSPTEAGNPGATSGATSVKDDIVERVAPQISSGAERTIRGRIVVRVRVEVDEAGNVTKAKIKGGRSGSYFAHAALDAARQWKFAQVKDEERRVWMLSFAFSRARTEMSALRAR
jgi:TonB family protein